MAVVKRRLHPVKAICFEWIVGKGESDSKSEVPDLVPADQAMLLGARTKQAEFIVLLRSGTCLCPFVIVMNAFLTYLKTKDCSLSPEAWEALTRVTKRITLPRRTLLHRGGDVCPFFYFIEEGLSRVFYYKDDAEITAWFGFPGQIVSAIDSFFTGRPSAYWIELLEPATLCALHRDDIEALFRRFPEVERLGRLLVIENYLLLDERMKLFVFHTAEERYELLLKQFPEATRRIPLGMIASYIGVSQETLSRIRKKK
jgi:CRP-like cAMP-binding protein